MKKEFQTWLNDHDASLTVDGVIGAKTRDAILEVFTNKDAPAISDDQLTTLARRIEANPRQIAAIAKVETNGSGFTNEGRPKILFERHKFWDLTDGQYPKSVFNDPKYGGYDVNSWSKLLAACEVDPVAAFCAASWGKFQIMGFHWSRLGYLSVFDMAYEHVLTEAAHYEALIKFIEAEHLQDAVRAISANPMTNRIFVKRYNGVAGIERNRYDEKLAKAME